jgi:hypothetical protein
MADYHQIVDEVRAFVQSSDQTRDGTFDSLASAYSEACVEVNQRMGRCHRLLQQGLRSEAIQLAESEPKLLDAIAALDFPERADWDELLRIYELPQAPKLSVEQAQFLNEAYAQEDPLRDLLRMHRRSALQRAPVRARISVLRKLAAQDANNPIWTDDLRTFEKARFREIQVEAAQAAQDRNLDALGQLVAELEQQSWVEPPPKALVQGLRKANAHLQGEHTRAAFTDLDARLNDAFTARDVIRGRLVRQEWIAMTAGAPLLPGDPIWERVARALQWLEDQDQIAQEARAHQEAHDALVGVLDSPERVSPSELERLAHAVLQYGRGMSEGIQQRYVARLRSAELAQTRRRQVVTGGVTAGAVVTLAVAFFGIRSWNRASDASQAATAMLDMVKLGEVERAESFLGKLQKADPGLLGYPSLVEAREKLQAIQEKELERVRQFDKMMGAAALAEIAQLNPPALESARKLARLQSEKDSIVELEKRRAADLVGERNKREEGFAPQIEVVSRKIAEIQQSIESDGPGKTDDQRVLGSMVEAQRALSDLGPELPYVGDSLKGRATVLAQKLETLRTQLDHRNLRARLETAITDAVAYSSTARTGDLTKFTNGLDAYIKAFPDHPRSRAFSKAREQQLLWNAVEAWNQLAAGWKDGLAGSSPENSKVRAEHCARFLAQHPGVPQAADIALFQKHFEAVHRRGFGAESANAKIQRLLSDILVENLWMLKLNEPNDSIKKYYLTRKPDQLGNFIQCVIAFDGKEQRKAIVADRIKSSDWSPQTKIAVRFKPILLQESALSDWEKLVLDLAASIRSQPDIEPVLQVALLRSILEQGAEGSEPLRDALTATRRILEQAEVNVNVPWMDPGDADAQKMRPKAERLVQSLPEFPEVRKRALAIRARAEQRLKNLPVAMGWLVREKDAWDIRCRPSMPASGVLCVVAPQENKQSHWKEIGAIERSKPHLSLKDDTLLVEGRPVFVMALAPDQP